MGARVRLLIGAFTFALPRRQAAARAALGALVGPPVDGIIVSVVVGVQSNVT